MEKKVIYIGDKEYNVEIAKTEEERRKGLSGRKTLDKDSGMLFIMPEVTNDCSFWMKDTKIPLDIIFINDNNEVISVHSATPLSTKTITEDNVKYVLEVNSNSGIKRGDDFDIIEDIGDSDKMLVLNPEGETQMELKGGERIFSRKSTKVMIKKAKKAKSVEDDPKKFESACKSLGKYLFKELSAQDNRSPEYVELKEDKK